MNKNKTGLIFGSFLAFFHLVWSVLVGLGIAQAWLNFILDMHMINMPITIMPFDLIKAIGLIVLTFVIGYIFGFVFSTIHNKLHKQA